MDGGKGNEEQDLCQYMCERWSCVWSSNFSYPPLWESRERQANLPPLTVNAVLPQGSIVNGWYCLAWIKEGEKESCFFEKESSYIKNSCQIFSYIGHKYQPKLSFHFVIVCWSLDSRCALLMAIMTKHSFWLTLMMQLWIGTVTIQILIGLLQLLTLDLPQSVSTWDIQVMTLPGSWWDLYSFSHSFIFFSLAVLNHTLCTVRLLFCTVSGLNRDISKRKMWKGRNQ